MNILIGLLFLVIVGLCFALPARIPAIRSRIIANERLRVLLTIGLGISALLTVYIIVSWINAAFEASHLSMGYETWEDYGIVVENDDRFTRELQHEIWLQMLSFSLNCSNPNSQICEIAIRTANQHYISGSWQEVTFFAFILSVVSGISSAFFTWRFTGYSGKPKRDKSHKAKVEA